MVKTREQITIMSSFIDRSCTWLQYDWLYGRREASG
jgi:hypothetical protein